MRLNTVIASADEGKDTENPLAKQEDETPLFIRRQTARAIKATNKLKDKFTKAVLAKDEQDKITWRLQVS